MGYVEVGAVQGTNWNKFKENIAKKYKDYKTNIEYSYRTYSIVVNDAFVETKLENTKEAREMLNDKLMFNQIKNTKIRYLKNKSSFGVTFNIQGYSNYVLIYSMLVKVMINEEASSIIIKEKIEEHKNSMQSNKERLKQEREC